MSNNILTLMCKAQGNRVMNKQQAFEKACLKIGAESPFVTKAGKKAMRRAAWKVAQHAAKGLSWLSCPQGQRLGQICLAETGNEWFGYRLFD
jgi:hypothetical protein